MVWLIEQGATHASVLRKRLRPDLVVDHELYNNIRSPHIALSGRGPEAYHQSEMRSLRYMGVVPLFTDIHYSTLMEKDSRSPFCQFHSRYQLNHNDSGVGNVYLFFFFFS